MSVVEGYIVGGEAVGASVVVGAAVGASGPAVDPLAALSDDFSTGSTMSGNGWTVSNVASPSDLITSGRADLTVAGGGAAGSFAFDNNDYDSWTKTVTGACDCRARVELRNTGNTDIPPATNFRIGALQAFDPDRSTWEYVHIGGGAANITVPALEWKTTDNSDSAYEGVAATLTGGLFLYDFRIVRTVADLQVFQLYARAGTSEALASDTGWTLVQTIDRTDDTSPDRATYGGTTAVALPETLQWGLVLYSAATTHNIRMFVDEVIFATPTA